MDAKRLLKEIDNAHEMLARVEKLVSAGEPTEKFGADCQAEYNAYLAACTVEENAATAVQAAQNIHMTAVNARDAAYLTWLNCESP